MLRHIQRRHPFKTPRLVWLVTEDSAGLRLQIGDWGRQGQYNQSELAGVMAAAAGEAPPDFVVSTGDNIYPSACLWRSECP